MVRKRDIKKAGLTTLFMGMSVLGFAQPTLINPFLSYGFGLQKMDFFHQVSMGIQRPKVRLELQQGFGQRNLSSGIVLSQTGVQGAYRIMCRNSFVNPYLRYAYGRLGAPFKFTHHQAECGVLYVYEWSNASKIPLDLLCSAGIGRGLEMQNQGSRHSYLDYSINVGIQYAFR